MKQLLGAVAAVAALVVGASTGASAQTENAVTILHGIPGITVDLRVDGELVIAGFDAGDTQDFTPLAGTVLKNIEAVRAGSDEVVIGPIDSFTVPDEGNTSVVVHLDNSGEPTITPFMNSTPPTEQGRGLLTVRHVADAAPVSVTIDDENVVDGIGNGEEGGVILPAGEVANAWITADGERLAPLPTLSLEANTQLIVYVGGTLEAGNLEFYLQQVAGSDIQAAPAQAAETEQADEEVDDAAGDGTPQPDVVNTGDAIGPSSGSPMMLGVGLALLLLASGALLARHRVLAGAADGSNAAPWGPPTGDSLVRRTDNPFS